MNRTFYFIIQMVNGTLEQNLIVAMRKDRLYLFTFLAITLLFLIISSISIGYFVDTAANKVLETQLEFSRREAKQVASLVGFQLKHGISKDTTIVNTQVSIENSNLEAGFVSVFDWSGSIVCHPDITKIGQPISTKDSFINSLTDQLTTKEFYELLQDQLVVSDEETSNETYNSSEVVYLHPVPNSDWIVAAHANTQKIATQIGAIRKQFLNILIVMGLVFILSTVVIVRLIGSNYEKKLEAKNQKLSDEVINLAKLNSAVDSYQQKVMEKPELVAEKSNEEQDHSTKKRILTYVRHELVPIAI